MGTVKNAAAGTGSYTLTSTKHSTLLFVACFVVYAASYVGRTNYSAALAAIVSEGLFTKPQMGIVGSVFFFCYGCFQIVWGFMGDRVSPFKMISAGVFAASLCNLVMPFCTSIGAMAVVWGLNGVSNSILWSPVLRVLANVLCENMRAKACLNISASLPVGTVLSYLLSTVIIKYSGWKPVFWAASAVLMGALVFFLITIKIIRPQLTYSQAPAAVLKTSGGKGIKLMPLFVSSGLLIAIVPTLLHGMLKEGVTAWVPTMLTETYTLSASFSVLLSIFLPIANVCGAYIVSPVYKKLMRKNELSTAAVCMAAAAVPLCMLMFMAKLAPVVSVMLLALCTMTMHAFNYMLITLVPVRFAKYGKTATLTGILNSSAYAGCALSTYGFGLIAERLGWQVTVVVWLVIVAVAGIICLALSKRWGGFCTNMEEGENERI